MSQLYVKKSHVLLSNKCSQYLLTSHINEGYKFPFLFKSIITQLKDKLSKSNEFKEIDDIVPKIMDKNNTSFIIDNK